MTVHIIKVKIKQGRQQEAIRNLISMKIFGEMMARMRASIFMRIAHRLMTKTSKISKKLSVPLFGTVT